jgi:hypothetical protein
MSQINFDFNFKNFNQIFNQIFNKKSWIYLLQIFFSVLFSILSLRVFNVAEKGEFLYLITVSSLIVGFFSIGFSNYIPIYFDRINFDYKLYRRLINHSIIIGLFGLIIWTFILYNDLNYTKVLKICCFVIYAMVIYLKSINDTVLQIINNTRFLVFYILAPTISNLIIISLIYFNISLVFDSKLYSFLLLSLSVELITNFYSIFFLKKYMNKLIESNFNAYVKESFKLYPNTLLSILSKKIDVLVLSKLGVISLGNYGVIISIREIIMVFFRVNLLDQSKIIKKNQTTWFVSLQNILPLTLFLTLSSIVIIFGFDLVKNDSFLDMKSILLYILLFIISYLIYTVLLNFLQIKMLYISLAIINISFIILQLALLLIDFNLTSFLLYNSFYYLFVFIIFSFIHLFKYSNQYALFKTKARNIFQNK